jgi:hypothetical protein
VDFGWPGFRTTWPRHFQDLYVTKAGLEFGRDSKYSKALLVRTRPRQTDRKRWIYFDLDYDVNDRSRRSGELPTP